MYHRGPRISTLNPGYNTDRAFPPHVCLGPKRQTEGRWVGYNLGVGKRRMDAERARYRGRERVCECVSERERERESERESVCVCVFVCLFVCVCVCVCVYA